MERVKEVSILRVNNTGNEIDLNIDLIGDESFELTLIPGAVMGGERDVGGGGGSRTYKLDSIVESDSNVLVPTNKRAVAQSPMTVKGTLTVRGDLVIE